MRLEDLDRLSLAGFVLATVGGLLALIPNLERLLRFTAAWQEPLLLGVLAGATLLGAWLVTRERTTTGGMLAAVSGIVLAVLGPTAAGLLAVIGGTFIYASGQDPGPTPLPREERAGGSAGGSTRGAS